MPQRWTRHGRKRAHCCLPWPLPLPLSLPFFVGIICLPHTRKAYKFHTHTRVSYVKGFTHAHVHQQTLPGSLVSGQKDNELSTTTAPGKKGATQQQQQLLYCAFTPCSWEKELIKRILPSATAEPEKNL